MLELQVKGKICWLWGSVKNLASLKGQDSWSAALSPGLTFLLKINTYLQAGCSQTVMPFSYFCWTRNVVLCIWIRHARWCWDVTSSTSTYADDYFFKKQTQHHPLCVSPPHPRTRIRTQTTIQTSHNPSCRGLGFDLAWIEIHSPHLVLVSLHFIVSCRKPPIFEFLLFTLKKELFWGRRPCLTHTLGTMPALAQAIWEITQLFVR